MSWAQFLPTGSINGVWAPPVRLTGEDGENGKDGKSIEFIYCTSNRQPTEADKPTSPNVDGDVPAGWTDHPSGISSTMQYEWMCVRTKTDDIWSDWSTPTIWANGDQMVETVMVWSISTKELLLIKHLIDLQIYHKKMISYQKVGLIILVE